MIDTVQVLLDQQFVQIQRYDAELHLAGRPAEEVAADVAAVKGVEDVEQALVVPVSVVGPKGSYSTTLTALEPGSEMHVLLGPDGHRLPVPAEGVVLGEALQGQLGIAVGDTVTLDVAGLDDRRRTCPSPDSSSEPLGYLRLHLACRTRPPRCRARPAQPCRMPARPTC